MTSRKLLPLVVALLAIALSLEPLAAMSAALCHALDQQAAEAEATVAPPTAAGTDGVIDVPADTPCHSGTHLAAAATTTSMAFYARAAIAPGIFHFAPGVSPRTLYRPPPAPQL